jgi:uncharacterized protein (TIGR00369 family)
MREPKLTKEELTRLLERDFSETFNATSGVSIDDLWHGGCQVRQAFHADQLRPGGTISGPTMMRLTDVAMYLAVLSAVGWAPLAVTTQINIHFMRKPAARDLVAKCRLLKVGKRLAVGEVAIRSDGIEHLVAHASSTYAIPASR